jgi:hypothetical protein
MDDPFKLATLKIILNRFTSDSNFSFFVLTHYCTGGVGVCHVVVAVVVVVGVVVAVCFAALLGGRINFSKDKTFCKVMNHIF